MHGLKNNNKKRKRNNKPKSNKKNHKNLTKKLFKRLELNSKEDQKDKKC